MLITTFKIFSYIMKIYFIAIEEDDDLRNVTAKEVHLEAVDYEELLETELYGPDYEDEYDREITVEQDYDGGDQLLCQSLRDI